MPHLQNVMKFEIFVELSFFNFPSWSNKHITTVSKIAQNWKILIFFKIVLYVACDKMLRIHVSAMNLVKKKSSFPIDFRINGEIF